MLHNIIFMNLYPLLQEIWCGYEASIRIQSPIPRALLDQHSTAATQRQTTPVRTCEISTWWWKFHTPKILYFKTLPTAHAFPVPHLSCFCTLPWTTVDFHHSSTSSASQNRCKSHQLEQTLGVHMKATPVRRPENPCHTKGHLTSIRLAHNLDRDSQLDQRSYQSPEIQVTQIRKPKRK